MRWLVGQGFISGLANLGRLAAPPLVIYISHHLWIRPFSIVCFQVSLSDGLHDLKYIGYEIHWLRLFDFSPVCRAWIHQWVGQTRGAAV